MRKRNALRRNEKERIFWESFLSGEDVLNSMIGRKCAKRWRRKQHSTKEKKMREKKEEQRIEIGGSKGEREMSMCTVYCR